MAGRYTFIDLPGLDEAGHVAENGDLRQWKLRYDMNAWQDLFDTLGITMEQVDDMEASPRAATAMLWAGLQSYHPDMSLRQVGALIDLGNLSYVVQTVGKEMARSQGDRQDPNPRRGRRKRSTSAGSGGTPSGSG